MSEENQNQNQRQYNAVADGTYNCVVVSVRRQEQSFGRDLTKHIVLSIGVRPDNGDENAQAFFGDLAILLTVGNEYGFYDKEKNGNIIRKVTSSESKAAWDYAERIFPGWKKHNEELPENASLRDSLAWFDLAVQNGEPCRAKLVNRTYMGKNGEKVSHDATLYPATSSNVIESFDAGFEKSLKASGIRIGKAAASAAKTAAAATPSAKPAPKPAAPAVKRNPPPAAPCAPAKVYTGDDAFAAYEEHCQKFDPDFSHYWEKVAEATGKPADEASIKNYTSADWEKCVVSFVGF